MNYNKVIKDLKERNDKLQEQYRLRDIRCIHLEYENEMLKSDFKAQHELTKKYAEESKELKNQLEGKNNPQIFIDTQDMEERYGEQLYQDYLEEENKKYKNQQKEFINYLESWKGNEEYCYLASNPIDRCRKDIYEEILQKYKEIIGVSDEKEN